MKFLCVACGRLRVYKERRSAAISGEYLCAEQVVHLRASYQAWRFPFNAPWRQRAGFGVRHAARAVLGCGPCEAAQFAVAEPRFPLTVSSARVIAKTGHAPSAKSTTVKENVPTPTKPGSDTEANSPKATSLLYLHRNFNHIPVHTFILPGAPIKSMT